MISLDGCSLVKFAPPPSWKGIPYYIAQTPNIVFGNFPSTLKVRQLSAKGQAYTLPDLETTSLKWFQ